MNSKQSLFRSLLFYKWVNIDVLCVVMVMASYRFIKVLHSQGAIYCYASTQDYVCKKNKTLVSCCCPPYLIVCLYVVSVKGFSDMGKRVRLQA